MHPKLMMLLFPDFLRICISSANIGCYEGKINQTYWIHDLPRYQPHASLASRKY